VAEEDGKGELQGYDGEDEVLCEGFVAAEFGDLRAESGQGVAGGVGTSGWAFWINCLRVRCGSSWSAWTCGAINPLRSN